MIEGDVSPVTGGIVAVGALSRIKVIGWLIPVVTRLAVGELAVIHVNLGPGNRRVTGRALRVIVIGPIVTPPAIGEITVIHLNQAPGNRRVAV